MGLALSALGGDDCLQQDGVGKTYGEEGDDTEIDTAPECIYSIEDKETEAR